MSPPLVDDLVEEVLLRFPPEEPAALVRAALVCKRWLSLVSGSGFRRRFCEFHLTPPMLGLFCWDTSDSGSRFVPTTAFRPRHAERALWLVLDARHGRVLFHGERERALFVWDPITDKEWKMPIPLQHDRAWCWTAAVLCSADVCDHLDCHRQSFTVVLVGSYLTGTQTFIYTYSSNAAAWSDPTSVQGCCFPDFSKRSALVGNTLYLVGMGMGSTVIKYNMQFCQMSWIQLPSSLSHSRSCALTTTEGGGLQLAAVHEYKLYIWSMKDADEVDARWEQNRVIALDTLLPADADSIPRAVVGSTDDLRTVFVRMDNNVSYAIDLKTNKVKKVFEGRTSIIVPYKSFVTPEMERAA